MKKKNLTESMFSFSIHGMDTDHSNYLNELEEYRLGYKNGNLVFPPKRSGFRFTLSAVLDTNYTIGYIGLSVCSPGDNFCRKTGREISTNKAIVFKDKSGMIKSGEPIAYFKLSSTNLNQFETKKEMVAALIKMRTLVKENVSSFMKRNLTEIIDSNKL